MAPNKRSIIRIAVVGFVAFQAWALLELAGLRLELPAGAGNPHTSGPLVIAPGVTSRDGRPPGTSRFAVIGDIQSSAVGDRLLRRLEEEPLDFLVLGGDLVRSGTRAHHGLLAGQLRALAPLPFPVLLAMGNRDVRVGLYGVPLPSAFGVADWEALYGPSQYWFSHGGDLYVVLRFPDPTWYLREGGPFLERVLEEQRDRHRHAVVFSHVPPRPDPGDIVPPPDQSDVEHVLPSSLRPPQHAQVKELCARYRVDLWVAGHHHASHAWSMGRTRVVVSGGGGGTLDDVGPAAFHHALIVTATPAGLHTETLADSWRPAPLTPLRVAAVARAAPWMRAHLPLLVGLNLAALALAFLLPIRRPEPDAGARPEDDNLLLP